MDEVDQTKVEDTTVQDSPTEEPKQATEEPEAGENQEQTPETEVDAPQEKNWRAIREELDALKAENKRLKSEGSNPRGTDVRTDLDAVYLTPQENEALNRGEIKAEIKFPELEQENIFSLAVRGKYREAMDQYVLAKSLGQRPKLPSVYEIAQSVKAEHDSYFGKASKQAEIEGAKKAQAAKSSREATVEAEGRSDRARTAASASELSQLRRKSREGDMSAVVERLTRLGQ